MQLTTWPHPPHKAEGSVGVMLIGLGAVATTFIAGCMLIRRGLAQATGSLAALGVFDGMPLRQRVPLASLNDLVFAAWDIFPDDALAAARHARVLHEEHLALVADELCALRPMPGVFAPDLVRRLRGEHRKPAASALAQVEALRADIRAFRAQHGLTRLVAIGCASTEAARDVGDIHATPAALVAALERDDPRLTPAFLYAYACVQEGVPFVECAPHVSVASPALAELAIARGVPVAGADLKTGQTMLKTAIAPALAARSLGVRGWFSTNVLGNRDGEVLDEPENFRTKQGSKLGVLASLLSAEAQPSLYGELEHQVQIHFYPPRGDAKQSWDAIDLFGWLGYDMQLKIDFACRDSILAAPLLLDLALFIDLAARAGAAGPQEWLSFYFKSPLRTSTHDLFLQRAFLDDALRQLF